ncbi:hypothetical protein E3N88_03047 [Mikania micrantha]|uniref:Reverse transcriptase zinc-binding domain-containing protein n=1 Tax=Mikania micrantha TaxID=192012 RepID=A0A5N6Q7S9_9ASTR|nr:hypothetical protein E3N88_03047 [Mikania micrantha]
MKDDGSSSSKIDRFLLCQSMILRWPMAMVKVLDRRWSDHRPIVLLSANNDYGPAPFRFYNSWLANGELNDIVITSWNGSYFDSSGAADYLLLQKLRRLKEEIKKWAKNNRLKDTVEATTLELSVKAIEAKAETSSLIIKWWWRALNGDNGLWSATIKAIHNVSFGEIGNLGKTSLGGIWASIIKTGKSLNEDGRRISSVIRRQTWNGDAKNQFSTRSCRDWIDEFYGDAPVSNIFWLKWVPPKVLCFVWKVSLDRIPVMVNLNSRGINVQSLRCSLCLVEDEDGEHLLFRCRIAQEVWRRISWWASIDFVYSGSIQNILCSLRDGSEVGLKRKIKMLLAALTIWCLWLCRNNWCFHRIRKSIDCLVEDVKLQAFTWAEQRGNKISTDWEKWVVNPWEGISKI